MCQHFCSWSHHMCGEHLVTFSSTTRESIPTLIYKEIFNYIITVANVLHETLRNVSLTSGDYYDYNNEIFKQSKNVRESYFSERLYSLLVWPWRVFRTYLFYSHVCSVTYTYVELSKSHRVSYVKQKFKR